MSIPHYTEDLVTLHHGECLDVLRSLPDASVDAIVTDPPYGLGFMGKAWDDLPPGLPWAIECLRVLKPGGHLLAFGGTRTWHRLAVAVEDAGFEVRDSIAWLYGSGFPKSMDVSKAIDKRGGNPGLADEIGAAIRGSRLARGWTAGQADKHFCNGSTNWTWYEGRKGECRPPTPATFARIVEEWPELAPLAEKVDVVDREVIGQRTTGIGTGKGAVAYIADTDNRDVTAPATPEAVQWEGWGTALKPAFEPIVVARKPLVGTVAANVLAHGTGALNIDECRIGGEPWKAHRATGLGSVKFFTEGDTPVIDKAPHDGGRWPANVVLDESQAEALDQQSGILTSGANPTRRGSDKFREAYGEFKGQEECTPARGIDKGGASRFFYVAKAPKKERPVVEHPDGTRTAHPTVKPLALMRWLVRLVTPPDGVVLEPFAGSGTTVEACLLEGFRCIAIEREVDYLPLIEQRIRRHHAARAADAAAVELAAAQMDRGLLDLIDEGETA